jgi:glucose-6-phosphate-specific signal transduction histidine kinase
VSRLHHLETVAKREENTVMTEATKRSIVRWIHLILSIPIIGYIYSPFDQISNYAPLTRYVFLPAMVLAGLWMWQGHRVRRLFSKNA